MDQRLSRLAAPAIHQREESIEKLPGFLGCFLDGDRIRARRRFASAPATEETNPTTLSRSGAPGAASMASSASAKPSSTRPAFAASSAFWKYRLIWTLCSPGGRCLSVNAF